MSECGVEVPVAVTETPPTPVVVTVVGSAASPTEPTTSRGPMYASVFSVSVAVAVEPEPRTPPKPLESISTNGLPVPLADSVSEPAVTFAFVSTNALTLPCEFAVPFSAVTSATRRTPR